MRLTQFEVKSILNSLYKVFGRTAKVFLFGSRVDNTIKGGDIDLYIQASDINIRKKFKFLIDLKSQIGEQKIDVILATDPSKLIEQEALKNGILL